MIQLLGDKLVPIVAAGSPTFKSVADEWTTGALHERFPDHVEKPMGQYRDTAEKRLAKAILPRLGSMRVAAVKREHCEEVMRHLPTPKNKKECSRETVASTLG